MNEDQMWERVRAARVGVLGTIRPDGAPHQVPFVYAAVDRVLVSAVDSKPKSGRRLARLVNIEAEPRVSVLVQRYDDDWSALWWVRVDGRAVVSTDVPSARRRALESKYPPYAGHELGPFVLIEVERLSGWEASGDRGSGPGRD